MRILHVFRTPVGGLFRHVRDLARGLQERGHDVGLLCDSTTGGETATRLLASAEPYCSLGMKRIPISRLPGLGDLSGTRQTIAHARAIQPDIIHCHGAKGGLYGRLAARYLGVASIYTAHGGSLHYEWRTPQGAIFLGAEKVLARLGSGLHFVCKFEEASFDAKIGIGAKPHAVVYNGLWPEDFATTQVQPAATDILFIGDMRLLKGVDVLLEALSIACRERPMTATLVGDGPDLERFKAKSLELGLGDKVTFPGRMSASPAFALGRLLVMPSRAESFPYIVLEAMAASVPLIASNVGGIPEVVPAYQLVPPGDAQALARAILSALAGPERMSQDAATQREAVSSRFGAGQMADGILDLYAQVIRQGATG